MYRMVIADDEPIECRALERKIREAAPGIELLPSVYDGMELLKSVEKNRPDIAIVDINMPGLSGLEAIELLKIRKMNLKIIINTAYMDFPYVQKALQLGASDYLLKPGDVETLSAALAKVCAELDRERRVRQSQEKNRRAAMHLQKIAAEKWLSSLMQEEWDEGCFQLLTEEIPGLAEKAVFVIWKEVPREEESRADCGFGSDHALGQLIGRLETGGRYILALTGNDMTGLCIVGNACLEDDVFQEETVKMLRQICADQKEKGVDVYTGVSRVRHGAKEYLTGFTEARLARQRKGRAGVCLFSYGAPREPESRRGLFDAIGQEPGEVSAEEVRQKIRQAVSECVPAVGQEEMDEYRVSALMAVMRMQQTGGCQETEAGMIRNGKIWEDFRAAGTLPELEEWLCREAEKCRESRMEETQLNSYITRALLFIRENYPRDISLADAAEVLGITSFYLSRLFKQEINLTFLEILTDVRMRCVITMMEQNQKTMKEISRCAGYTNMAYFYKVFKKMTGLTAGEMKQYLMHER